MEVYSIFLPVVISAVVVLVVVLVVAVDGMLVKFVVYDKYDVPAKQNVLLSAFKVRVSSTEGLTLI